MSDLPEHLYYTADHEWIRIDGDELVVGITDHAQDALTDIVYVELPDVGMIIEEQDEFASIESVKSVSGIFAPLSGSISKVNEELDDSPELINQDPYGAGWIVRIVPTDLDAVNGLLNASSYRELIGE
ncbi:MAG TPA: glycine cleavage system protein GcvH [Candidatus Thalassarchaeaceae archaeon]|jgi:glycine cleavage system H protein|nr:glycine cleavage system protein GcvH [Candidatus Thalassarchaeaceae archaeon]DAC50341.1 MAG TPA: glycine cleavage system protein GcvH [Candidatus Poseidoniales archaeon]HIH83053.1 glycine cleavage system protein GcvH [Candidatus Thalassarchaeaceae archaeon]|tara:strand:- start:111 stop:494 length:384 start_codon:yes stop_codon:yes gene_type:complete